MEEDVLTLEDPLEFECAVDALKYGGNGLAEIDYVITFEPYLLQLLYHVTRTEESQMHCKHTLIGLLLQHLLQVD